MVGDPSREDAAADAVARAVWPGALADAALVDDHRVARDAAGVVGQPLLQLDAKRLSMAERADPRAMRSEVSAEGVVGREMAYRWESGACAKVRPLKSWQMKPAGDHTRTGYIIRGMINKYK